ncbi:hypothetical protein HanRHA438_Chr12g0537761 [Helianthus annuus]|nr:hypothetical protein HanRHA438_Chr12g0537761 [Helianthus annuus]
MLTWYKEPIKLAITDDVTHHDIVSFTHFIVCMRGKITLLCSVNLVSFPYHATNMFSASYEVEMFTAHDSFHKILGRNANYHSREGQAKPAGLTVLTVQFHQFEPIYFTK